MNRTRVQTVVDILDETSSITRPELLAALSARGLPTSDEQFDELWHDPALGDLAQIELLDPQLVVSLPATLVGRIFTHRLTTDEIDGDQLATVPDFAAVWPLLDTAPFDVLDDEPLEDATDETTLAPVIRLAKGTLAGYRANQLIAVSVTSDGLHLESAPEPEEHQLLAQTLGFFKEFMEVFGNDLPRTVGEYEWDDDLDPEENLEAQERFAVDQRLELEFDELDRAEPVGAVPLEELLLLACVRHPDLFTAPGWPVSDVLIRQQLDHEDGMVAVAGFDFDAANEARDEAEEFERISETYELADAESLAVLAFTDKVDELHDAIHEWVDDGELEEDFPDVAVFELLPHLPALAEPMVAVAIADESLSGDPHLGSMLAMILETVQPQLPRRAQAGWHWLLGRCQDLLSAFTEAEALYERALELDADFYPSLRELASLASLRGDAPRAVSLLQRAAVPADDPELQMVSRFVGESRTDVGRNEPCWCGSGRKYKRCHLGRSDFDLAARREWLYEKVAGWVRNGHGRDLVIGMAAVSIDPSAGPKALVDAVLDPMLTDIAIFEGGLLDEFRQTRASALPSDEQELLTTWSETRRSLFLIESVEQRAAFTAREAVTGAVVTILGPPGSGEVGDLVCTRPLPAEGSLAALGGVVIVAPEQRDLVVAVLDLQGTDEVDPIRTATALFNARN